MSGVDAVHVIVAVLIGASVVCGGASPASAQLPIDLDEWRIVAQDYRVETHLGREALFLERGSAWFDGVDFEDGVIEFDLAATAATGFHGIRFRPESPLDHEHLYLRPHLSGKPDAVQYNPIFNGASAWQLFGHPRFIQPMEIPADRWVRVRIAVQGRRVEVSLDGRAPIVFPELMRASVSGPVALASSAAPAWFANVSIRPGADPEFEGGAGADPMEMPDGSVYAFAVSDAFAEALIDGVVELPDELRRMSSWVNLEVEANGVANLARVRLRMPEENTVFAALTLTSDRARTLPIDLGFSDRVRVFLNGRQIYHGRDEFSSRDYRFLGTMGDFDTVFLPLEAGDNDLRLAISENFGGWGVSVRIADETGVSVSLPVGEG